jgi:hypothetical protein
MTESTVPKQLTPCKPGNPAGRPKGSRNKLGEKFIEDFYSDWLEHGMEAIAATRKQRPHKYLKAAIAILPKEVRVESCRRKSGSITLTI